MCTVSTSHKATDSQENKEVAASKKLKVKRHRKLIWESTDTSIVKVTGKGTKVKFKGLKKGTCYVYAYAQNGIYKRIKVTVK